MRKKRQSKKAPRRPRNEARDSKAGQLVRAEREARGWTRMELALKAGYRHDRQIYRIENGEVEYTPGIRVRMEHAFGDTFQIPEGRS